MRKLITIVFVFSTIAFNFVLSQSDNPCEAPSLNPGATCNFNPGSLPNTSTPTPGIPVPGCGNYNGQDVWYKVVVPANGKLNIDLKKSPGPISDMGMAWYSAATCNGPFTLIECDKDDSNNGLMPKIERTGMTPGSTVWVRLWEEGGNANGNFQICSSSSECLGGSNNSCSTAAPFCTGVPLNYCNSTGVPSIGQYDCLSNTKNPMWLYMKISTPGSLDILITQEDAQQNMIDVDFALYGPFPNLASACGSINPNTDAIDCSYSPAGTETANIANAQVGEYYMMLVTNYEDEPGSIEFTQTGGTGSTDCNIVLPCTVSAIMVSDTCNNGVGKVTATPVAGLAPYTYVWTTLGNQTTPTVNGVAAGVHSVTMTTSDGCVTTATVTVANITPTASATTTPVSCPAGSNGTATANMLNTTGNVTYLWNDANAQTTQTATGLKAGTYICTMTSQPGCTITKSVTVEEIPGMIANILNTQNVNCSGGNDGLIAVNVAQGTAPYTYSWDHSASTTNSAGDLSVGVHTVNITDANGCVITQSANLSEPTVFGLDFITPDSTICPEKAIDIQGNASGGTLPYTYSWTSNNVAAGTTQSIHVDPNVSGTQYCVTIKDACGSSADSCLVLSFPVPIVPMIIPDTTSGCTPAIFTFTNLSTPADQIATTLFNFGNGLHSLVQGTGNASTVYQNAQSYTVDIVVTSIYGCEYAAAFPHIVEAVASPNAAFVIASNPTTIYETTVFMQNNSSSNAIEWNWTAPGATPASSTIKNPSFYFPEGVAGMYPIQLIVKNELGCVDTAVRILAVYSDIVLYAPNSFTPNGDEFNQTWRVYTDGIDVNQFELIVFDRWGEVIWESHDPDAGWDATYSGQKVPQGTYVWKASVKSIFSEEKKEFHGFVNVLN